jgi:predicted helicase
MAQSPLQQLLDKFRASSLTEREKGTYFEELIQAYLKNEASYKDLYSNVWTYSDWAKEQHLDQRDTGIDLVALTNGTNEYHAIQCKFYDEEYVVKKADIDSFFTASGKKIFSHRIIVTTTNNWSEHAEDALQDQNPPVTKIDFHDLDNSQIDWSQYQPKEAVVFKKKKELRDHQKSALTSVVNQFKNVDRGKLIMACGTGKTFTSLKIAEAEAGKGGRVLFLVPSLSLLSQTLTEWTQESATPLHSFAVCSDSDVGKKRKKTDDTVQTFTHELRYPSTTEPRRLAEEILKRHDDQHMSVVFSTYHSIQTISDAQKEFGLAEFDIIICDEAHRTTGATFDDEEESNFVRVHDASFIKSKKRLYMTATPRIYGEMAKAVADKDNVALCSMDDEKLYGKELYVITFSEAVKQDLLVDYKVLVLAVDEAHINARLQRMLADENNQLKVDDAAKIIGCWKALSKQGTEEDLGDDHSPMKRAVAFCQVIEPQKEARTHKVSSKNIASIFEDVVRSYQEQEEDKEAIANKLICEAEHIDGGMNASQKEEKLDWLKAPLPENTCRILSNVRCLSEGVDVPALDAVLFLTPRNSQVDVVQSVGRVMRKSEGKKRGYVVLPVVIPADKEPHEALNDNQTYKVVWQVLQALRSHDDRFDAMVNKLDLIGKDVSKMEVIAITDKVPRKPSPKEKSKNPAKGKNKIGGTTPPPDKGGELQFHIGEIERAIYAKVVQKCGNRMHWEDWANDVAKIAKAHIERITLILENTENKNEILLFNKFAKELRDDLNNYISDQEIIEMLAQHLITKPVFDSLFDDYDFAKKNTISVAIQKILDALESHNLEEEHTSLVSFYESVRLRASGIKSSDARQKIIIELYDKFFKNAFPKLTEKLGIVYTPIEIVDFIIKTVNDLLISEFNQSLNDKDTKIIDPFTGTGTFVTRLLQSGLIEKENLKNKYKNDIHANEIILLAYYIANINIESTYHELTSSNSNYYQPFEGICFTDTFQLHEKEDLISDLLIDNSARREKQKKLNIKVIIGNPPYSSGQKSANDDNKNIEYKNLDNKISDTYLEKSLGKGGKRASYDSYIRAIRWATDRLNNDGVIGFITGNGFIDKPAMDGMRSSLFSEFSSIYIINLRGDIRKNILSKGNAREGENVFGSGSMTGIAITFFVKNSLQKEPCKIFYHDIGDDLKTEQKLILLNEFRSREIIKDSNFWQIINPNKHNDWINQRNSELHNYLLLGSKKKIQEPVIFKLYSNGVVSNRDEWVYNFSKKQLIKNVKSMIDFYNSEVKRYESEFGNLEIKKRPDPQTFVEKSKHKISWGGGNWQSSFKRLEIQSFSEEDIEISSYRPFTKLWHYKGKNFNHSFYSTLSIFPNPSVKNKAIHITGIGARSGFSVLMINTIPDIQHLDNGLCFPLKIFEKKEVNQSLSQHEMFESKNEKEEFSEIEAITYEALKVFRESYPSEKISYEDIFYYIYGILHSNDFKDKFRDNLNRELLRIPCVKLAKDFWIFSNSGKELSNLHINYDEAELYPVNIQFSKLFSNDYSIEAMKIIKDNNCSSIVYNQHIVLSNIPEDAFEYNICGKSAIQWVVDRRRVTQYSDSNLTNDCNNWALETMNNPKYSLELIQRMITVSLETMKIVKALPKLDI